MRPIRSLALLLATAATTFTLHAQAPQPAPAVPQYGPNVTQDVARRAIAGAVAESRRIGVPMAVAVVDTAGMLVAFERLDNTQAGSIAVAQDKAVSAALYRRPTKVFQDGVAAGGAGLRLMMLRGAIAVEGGFPLMVDGRVVGAIGASGGTGEQDSEVARGGLAALAR